MKRIKTAFLTCSILFLSQILFAQTNWEGYEHLFTPVQNHVVYQTKLPVLLDGKADEPDWQKAEWTADFADIEGDKKPKPLFRTRMKMLWDESNLYLFAELEDPNIWAYYDTHDQIVYHENEKPNMKRRNFIKYNSLAVAGVLSGSVLNGAFAATNFVSNRPPVGKRNFSSKAVEETILMVKKAISNPELAWMFENCFPNTLDTTVDFSTASGTPDTFVITGDIHAMWLRDSTAQVWPYLSLVKDDEQLDRLFQGVLHRQAKCILIDPYANAFNKEATGGEWETDDTDMKPELHERKWEIDSLCYPVRLLYNYWKTTGNTACFTAEWHSVFRSILTTFKKQQRKLDKGDYHFTRVTHKPTDTLCCSGFGNPVNPVGLIVSAFRPSDDATIYPFLIPSNYFAVTSLNQIAEMAEDRYKDQKLADEARQLASEVAAAIEKYAIAEREDFGKVIAFEVDGFGNRLFMDDANIPSLLALPYLGAMELNNPLYQNTRKLVLSEANPWFFKGKAGEGIGGPHVGADMIWPMSITMRAMTSTDDEEIISCIRTLLKTHAGTGFMHETFHKDNPENFSRSWFAWANTLFGELILKLYHSNPELLKKI